MKLNPLLVALAAVSVGLSVNAGEKIQVLCVGDSNTYGSGVEKTRDKDSYPAQLQAMLGDNYEVVNSGVGGTTGCTSGKRIDPWHGDGNPYNRTKEHEKTLAATENAIVVIMFGTNDSGFWGGLKMTGDRWAAEYKAFVGEYLAKNPKKLILVTAPKIFKYESLWWGSAKLIDDPIIPKTREIAKELKGVTLVDFYQILSDHGAEGWVGGDHIHLAAAGYKALAEAICKEIPQGK